MKFQARLPAVLIQQDVTASGAFGLAGTIVNTFLGDDLSLLGH
jgi:hypothetical protein